MSPHAIHAQYTYRFQSALCPSAYSRLSISPLICFTPDLARPLCLLLLRKSMSFWKPGSSSATAAAAVTSPSIIVDEGGAGRAEVAPASQFNFSRKPLDLQRQALPIARHRRQILYAVEKYPVTIIVGETGERRWRGGGGRWKGWL